MSVKLRLNKPADEWKTVTIATGDFEVLVHRPDFGTKMREINSLEDRIRICIKDWRGINDENDQPIPFSWESLCALCEQSDRALSQLITLTGESTELSEDSEKNSVKPSSELSTDAATVKT